MIQSHNASIMASGAGFGLQKPGEAKVRPICIAPALRRITASVLAGRCGPSAATLLSPVQFSINTRDGCNVVISAARAFMARRPECLSLQVDISTPSRRCRGRR